ncbi:CpaD family pilus assembly lipoprotein [Solirhodobacter olei]|uniref:CpaD family pilus assembly lipoprotein n=1 Tax=Solirhodobacter olei TaxID=2493082 RepID=UPI0013E329CE|nr:CpaD family pilus assembly lipoprotein [Solirhodobacter olei]
MGRVATLLLLGLSLSACAPDVGGIPEVQSTLKPNYSEAQFEFAFARGAGHLSVAERTRMIRFLGSLDLTRSDEIIATVPASGLPRTDAERARDLRGLLALRRAKVQILMPAASFDTHPGGAGRGILRVLRADGVTADCGQPSYHNLGCATASNLAAMIADPGDVLAPAQTGTAAH